MSNSSKLMCPYCREWDCSCECVHSIPVPNPKTPHITEVREFTHCPLCGKWIDLYTTPQGMVKDSLRKAIAMLRSGESCEKVIQRLEEVIYDQTDRQSQ